MTASATMTPQANDPDVTTGNRQPVANFLKISKIFLDYCVKFFILEMIHGRSDLQVFKIGSSVVL